MKLLRIVVEGLPLFHEKLDICFYAQQRVSEEQKDFLYPLFSTVFLNTTNVFAGINASGKTSTLRVILFALHLLSGKPINSMSIRSLGLSLFSVKIFYILCFTPFSSHYKSVIYLVIF